jgi:UDP-GlcNAc:undecaprenyl-phosphate/decaprenyl-phosphate GlcNAc-1-phosphate transferase
LVVLVRLFSAYLVSVVIAVVATPIARRVALRVGFLAMPVRDRWHRTPVPLLGGLAMAAALAGGLLTIGISDIGSILPLVVCSGLMFALGAIDDFWTVSPLSKLVAQMIVAGLVLWLMPHVVITGAPLVDQLLAFAWIVGITNAFNLLDNMDGLAAGVATVAGIFCLSLLVSTASPQPLQIAVAAFLGATSGFLLFSFPPASVFMGDSGSFLLGSFLAAATLFAAPAAGRRLVPAAVLPVLILLVPIFDTAFVALTRRLAGRRAWQGGRDHTSHRLVALGASERTAVIVLYALAIAGGLVAVGLQWLHLGSAIGLIVAYLVLLTAVGVVLGHVKAPSGDAIAPGLHPPLVSEVAYRRRVLEVLLDAALLCIAYYAAFRIRFQDSDFDVFFPPFARTFPIVAGAELAGLYIVGKYRQVWRSTALAEVIGLLKGVALGIAGALLVLLLVYRFERFSRGVFMLDLVFAWFLLAGSRATIAAIDEYLRKQRATGRPALIYGAGRGGMLLINELLQNRDLDIRPIGFIDDDPAKRGLRVEGVPVVGRREDLPAVVRQYGVTELLVSMRDIDATEMNGLLVECRRLGLTLRRMRFSIDEVRSVVSVVRHDR